MSCQIAKPISGSHLCSFHFSISSGTGTTARFPSCLLGLLLVVIISCFPCFWQSSLSWGLEPTALSWNVSDTGILYFGEENYRLIKTMLSTRTYTGSKIVAVSWAWLSGNGARRIARSSLDWAAKRVQSHPVWKQKHLKGLVIQYSTCLDDMKA